MTNLQIIQREKFFFVLTSLVYLASGLALQKISLKTNRKGMDIYFTAENSSAPARVVLPLS